VAACHSDGQAALIQAGADHRLRQPDGQGGPYLLDHQGSLPRAGFKRR